MSNFFVNLMWFASTWIDAFDFNRSISRAHQKQEDLLKKLLKRNKDTLYGQENSFSKIKGVRDYQETVSVRTYEEFSPWIDMIIQGKKDVLTSDPVLLLEPTGGTSAGSKFIPYTKSLKMEFLKGIRLWIFDTFYRFPSTLFGRSYWSISPINIQKQYSSGGIPIGFEDDAEYLGLMGKLLRHSFAVPSLINRVKNIDNFRYLTAYFLLKAKDLSTISIWNPTFLLLIIECIESSWVSLIDDIRIGKISLPVQEDIGYLNKFIKANSTRAKELESVGEYSKDERYSRIWKQLKLISCWMDASAKGHARQLSQVFPGVRMSPKGLIATECFVSIPFVNLKGCLPAYTSHFLEFIGQDNIPKLVDELELEKIYKVVVTTGGGLYRYDIKDRVKVVNKFKGLPLLEFVGRDKTLDIVGEKLDEVFVQNVVKCSLKEERIDSGFVMLSPQIIREKVQYILFLQLNNKEDQQKVISLRDKLENELKENFHYKYALELNQLLPMKIFLIQKNATQDFTRKCVSDGQRLGDIKQTFLDGRLDWMNHFEGSLVN